MSAGEPLRAAIVHLALGESLTAEEAAAAFDVVMGGGASPVQVAALLVGLRVKGETVEEVTGGARALRRAMIPLELTGAASLVDTCGTGGGRVHTFNISTAAALVAAGAGVRVAKHGNRSFTSLCGSADVLEALGVRIELPVGGMARVLDEAGIVFMYAPLMHPAMRHVGPVRRELAIPTVMNILGPLANPAGAGRQVVGVADEGRLPLLAGALAALGSEHALVVHGEPGVDEISPLGPTRVIEVRRGTITEWVIRPEAFGLGVARPEDVAGTDPRGNARIVLDVLEGRLGGGARAAVVLNAAAAIYVAGNAATFADGVRVAGVALDGGGGREALTRLRRATADATG